MCFRPLKLFDEFAIFLSIYVCRCEVFISLNIKTCQKLSIIIVLRLSICVGDRNSSKDKFRRKKSRKNTEVLNGARPKKYKLFYLKSTQNQKL